MFIDSGGAELAFTEDLRETIGRAIHNEHRRHQAAGPLADLPEWDQLDPELRESSMLQADHIGVKLERIGCHACQVTDREIALLTFTDHEVEILAEMEHGRWNMERLSRGWTLSKGKKANHELKLSPWLLPWAELPDYVKEWDRQTVRKIPEYLAQVQLEIRRVGPG